jgi:hypothetical protein
MAQPQRSKPASAQLEAVVALYEQTWAEINRLRDYEWKIAYYFVSLSAGQIALLASESFRDLLTPELRVVLSIIQVLAALHSLYYLDQTHEYLTQQRNIRRGIEEYLGLDECGFLPGQWHGKRVERKFERLGLVIPLAFAVLTVQIICVYLIWKIQ